MPVRMSTAGGEVLCSRMVDEGAGPGTVALATEATVSVRREIHTLWPRLTIHAAGADLSNSYG